jgi:glutaredoxin-related protein
MPTANLFGNSALFGIAWEVVITTDPSSLNSNDQASTIQIFDNGSYSQEALEIQFNVGMNIDTQNGGFWFADISIFNLTDATMETIVKSGQGVKLSAGWANGNTPYGTLFEGTVYQPMWERIDGINYKLTLRCIVGLLEQTLNFTKGNLAAGATQRALVASMVANAVVPMQSNFSDNIRPELVVPSSRGEVYFGQPGEYLQQVAAELQSDVWISNLTANVRNIIQLQDNIPTYQYNSSNGLIGTPQQTEDGVVVRVLLDPRVNLAEQIQLTPQVAINQVPRTQGSYPNIVDQGGTYGIVGIRHVGDSRGNKWETELTCVTYLDHVLTLMEAN